MFKGIALCLLFLAAQLLFLFYVDHRTAQSRSEVTYSSQNPPPQPRQRDGSVNGDDEDASPTA